MGTPEDRFKEKYLTHSVIALMRVRDVKEPVAQAEIQEVEKELTELMDGIKPSDEMLKAAYFATKGQVTLNQLYPSYDFQTILSYKHSSFWMGSTFGKYINEGYEPEPFIKRCDIAYLKFLKWYDQTLRDNGMEYPLMCIEHSREHRGYHPRSKESFVEYTHYYKDRKEISQCEDAHEVVCFWEPIAEERGRKLGLITTTEHKRR